MNLIVDIGNTRIKCCIINNNDIIALKTFGNEEYKDLQLFVSSFNIEYGAWAASGYANGDLLQVFNSFPFTMKEIKVKDIPKSLIKNYYNTPETLGIDRIASVIGALEHKGADVLVIDIGTCITYDFATADREYLGGNISPGIELRIKAMHDYTAKLPIINPEGDVSLIGKCTENALRNGVILGVEQEIFGIINLFRQKHTNLSVYLTGGATHFLRNSDKNFNFVDDFLVIRGLNIILNETIKLSK